MEAIAAMHRQDRASEVRASEDRVPEDRMAAVARWRRPSARSGSRQQVATGIRT
jgi:alkylhydroperoxidase family enzyme